MACSQLIKMVWSWPFARLDAGLDGSLPPPGDAPCWAKTPAGPSHIIIKGHHIFRMVYSAFSSYLWVLGFSGPDILVWPDMSVHSPGVITRRRKSGKAERAS